MAQTTTPEQAAQARRAAVAAAVVGAGAATEPGSKFGAAEDPELKRLGNAIEAAAVPRWKGTPEVTELPTPNTGERVYKVSNGTSVYCTRIPSPAIGIDRYERQRGNNPIIKCPR